MLYVRFLHLFPHFIDISAQYLLLSPVRTLLSFLSPSVLSAKLRSKAVYALSSTLQHSANAVRQLHEADGWDAFKSALEGEYRLSIHSGDRFMLTEKNCDRLRHRCATEGCLPTERFAHPDISESTSFKCSNFDSSDCPTRLK